MIASEDVLDEALSMIDLGRWGLRGRIFCEIRRLQRRSEDGWAYVGCQTLALRLKCSERYVYQLLGANQAGNPGVGGMWRVQRVLIRGQVGAGHRGTAYRINPRVDQWRSIPWAEDNREARRIRLEAALAASDRGADQSLAPRSHGAALENLAPRSHGAALDPLAPRSMSRRWDPASAATYDRGANLADPAPSPSSCNSSTSTSREEEERDPSQERIRAAVYNHTDGGTIFGKKAVQLERLAALYGPDAVVAAVRSARAGLGVPAVLDHAEQVCALNGNGNGRGPGLADLARRRQTLAALSAEAGTDDDYGRKLAADLAECETAIRRLEGDP